MRYNSLSPNLQLNPPIIQYKSRVAYDQQSINETNGGITSKNEQICQLPAIFRYWFLYKYNSLNNMRNHFAQTLPFPKGNKEYNHKGVDEMNKYHNSSIDQTAKKNNFYANESSLKTEVKSSFKTQVTIHDQEIHQKNINSFRNIENAHKVAKFNPFLGREKKPQASKIQRSPQKIAVVYSPHHLKESKALTGVPVRATLKTLLQTNGLTSLDRSFQKNARRVQSPNIKISNSITVSRCNVQSQAGSKSLKLLQKQNLILREENELLKCEMTQIKKHLMSVASYKKEETISNLRETIKKQDNQIKELRLKLQISNKKASTLNTLLENKEEEIEFLNSKITQLQCQIVELKERNAQKIEHLKQKMTIVVKGYTQLQQKFNSEQKEWIAFTENWIEQKSTYIHRISFLQSYISNNH